MSDNVDLFISNGTCYFADNRKADAAMIPCGNDANDHIACCQAGDYCLESSVCFNGDNGVTYIAGCSDPNYEHPSCPDKFDHQDMPWLGMAYCNGTSNEWVLCTQGQKPSSLTKPDPCYCPKDKADRTMTLYQSEVILYTALLPTAELESISFNTGYYPMSKSHPATTTAISATAVDSSSAPPISSSPAPTAAVTGADTAAAAAPDQGNGNTGLSPSMKIGAIAGAVAGGLLLGVLFAGFLCIRRRQKQKLQKEEEEARAVQDFMHGETKSGPASEPDPLNLGITIGGGPPPPSAASSPDTPALSELDSKAARPWSLRSELDNNPSARSSYNTSAGGHHSGHGAGGGQARPAPSELAAHPIAELPG